MVVTLRAIGQTLLLPTQWSCTLEAPDAFQLASTSISKTKPVTKVELSI